MNLKQLEAFIKIANNRSFSQTATELYMAQPTVSANINSLEKELGIKLFVRKAKGAFITDEGKKMYIYARQIIESANTITNMFGSETPVIDLQELVLCASSISAQYLLPDILARFSRQNHTAQFNVREMSSLDVIHEIEEHTADLGFTGIKTDSDKCEFCPFYKDEIVMITPDNRKFRELKKNESPIKGWLENESIIMSSLKSGTRLETIRMLDELGIRQNRLKIVANIDNPSSILASVQKGVGVAFISALAAKNYVDDGKIIEFPLEGVNNKRDIYMVYNSKLTMSASTQSIIKLVKKMYNNS